MNLNIVYTPRFDPDRFITGRRLSYYNSGVGRISGRDAVIAVESPKRWFEDDEIALRLFIETFTDMNWRSMPTGVSGKVLREPIRKRERRFSRN